MRVKSQNSQSIAITHPQLASEWHPTRNGDLTPEMFSEGSTKKKIWWLGKCSHEWLSIIYNRARGGGCPICSGHKVLIGFNDLSTSDPDVAAQWHPTLNGELTPEMVTRGSRKRMWWQCAQGHEWEAVICSRSIKKLGCPYCANSKVLVGYNDFATTHPDIAAQWHPTLNGDLTPEMVTAGNSGNKVWWLGKCGHEWDTDVKTRVRHKSGCPYCSGHKIQAGFNDLATVCPQLAAEWHPSKNGAVTPHMIGRGSEKKVWWVCKEGHEWKSIVKARLGKLSRDCPYCAGTLTLIGLNDLFTTRPHLAAEWHPTKNVGEDPQKLRAGNGTKVWWQCTKGHEWSAKVADRARPDGKANNCPTCAASIFISRGEQGIADYLTQELGLTIAQSNRRLLKGMEIDIYVPEKRLAIEYNGVYWHSTAMQSDHQYHQKKYELAQQAGIQLLQVWEDDWANKQELVKRLLAHKLGESREPLIGARQTCVEAIPLAEARTFLNEHHIQGHSNGSHYLGLRSKETNELVALMVLVKRSAQNNTLDIVRYATSHRVPGGFTKLLKHVETTLQPSRLVTFADHCISDGRLYAQNGFTAEKELKPDYRYLVQGQRAHKFGYCLARFKSDPKLLWEPNLTETQLAQLNGLHRVYDAGKTRWVKNLLTD